MAGKYSRQKMSLPPGRFETERLILMPLALQHEQALWEMFSDPDFIRYVPFPLATDREASRKLFHNQIKGGERFKFHLGIEWKEPPEGHHKTAGFGMCRPTEDGKKIEIGYCVHPKCWGKGLGSEATAGLVNQVALAMGVPKKDLIAKIMPDNIGSIKVAEKSGFKAFSEETEDGHTALVMQIRP